MNIKFRRNWYLILFITLLVINFFGFTLQVASGNTSTLNMIGLLIAVILLGSLFLFSYKTNRIIVKVWSGLIIATGALGLFSSFLFLILGNPEKVHLEIVLRRLLFLVFGYLVFYYWDKVTMAKEKQRK